MERYFGARRYDNNFTAPILYLGKVELRFSFKKYHLGKMLLKASETFQRNDAFFF